MSIDRLPTITIAKGGTGATTAADARTNLGITLANLGAAPATNNGPASFGADCYPLSCAFDNLGFDQLDDYKSCLGSLYDGK